MKAAEEFFTNRDIKPDWEVSPDHTDYVRIYSFGRTTYQDRAMAGQSPRFYTPGGNKGLFWVTPSAPPGAPVWVCEGPNDAFALHRAGAQHVAALMGSSMTVGQAYELRRTTVMICLDADAAGYTGARKEVRSALQDMEIPHVVCDLPEDMGKDAGEVWMEHPQELKDFVQKQEARIAPNEQEYVGRLFDGNEERLLEIPTPIPKLNDYLRGGWKTGVHLLAGVPGAGKTCLAVRMAVGAQQQGFRTLFVSQEISKRQMWARIASTLPNAPSWEQLEGQPESLQKKSQKVLAKMSNLIHVRTGWTVERIEQAMGDYDMVVVDYIQRMPDAMGGDESTRRGKVGDVAKRLSNLARDLNKVVIIVSSMPRSAYGKGGSPPTTLDIFKESGDIEYVAQSASSIFGTDNLLTMHVIKNTRGIKDRGIPLVPDLAHCAFNEPERRMDTA